MGRAVGPRRGNAGRRNLKDYVLLSVVGWATPQARDHKSGKASAETTEKNTRPLSEQVMLVVDPAGWASPTASSKKRSTRFAVGPSVHPLEMEALTPPHGWPTPDAGAAIRGGDARLTGGRSRVINNYVLLAGWPTPTAEDGNRGHKGPREHDTGIPLSQMAVLAAGWPTPTSLTSETDEYNRAGESCNLRQIRLLAGGWATPRANSGCVGGGNPERAEDGKARLEDQVYLAVPTSEQAAQLPGPTASGSSAATGKQGALNPAFPRWLMGFPRNWDRCAPAKRARSARSTTPRGARWVKSRGASEC